MKIYWQFISGKVKAFNCLIYMHRNDRISLSHIRTDYLNEYQIRFEVERQNPVNIIDGDYTTSEVNDAKKELKLLDEKITELKDYDEVFDHMSNMQIEIDLEYGIKLN